MTRDNEIIVKVLIENDCEIVVRNSIKEAAQYVRDQFKDETIAYVMEIERLEGGVCRGHDRKEEFEQEWLRLEREAIEDDFHFGLQDNDRSLDALLSDADRPVFLKSNRQTLLAAE